MSSVTVWLPAFLDHCKLQELYLNCLAYIKKYVAILSLIYCCCNFVICLWLQTRTRVASLEGLSNPKSPFEHVDLYRDYTGVRSRVSDTGGDSDVGHGSFLEYETSDQSSPIQVHLNLSVCSVLNIVYRFVYAYCQAVGDNIKSMVHLRLVLTFYSIHTDIWKGTGIQRFHARRKLDDK